MPEPNIITEALEKFKNHYAERLGQVKTEVLENANGIKNQCNVTSEKLRDGNYPTIFYHGQKTKDVIVLTHGLSDSPYYMQAIGRRLYAQGLNVILPLLPAHGLKDPDDAMEDNMLDAKWKKEIDHAVDVAILLGERVSLGGFSTGGALSFNKVLRHPEMIGGGIFLFSAALDLGLVKEEASRLKFIQSLVAIIVDRKIKGIGPNPYKYPQLPRFAGMELAQIIQENEKILKELEKEQKKISHPVFIAHSVHDTTVKFDGILEVLRNHVASGLALIISENVSHEEVVLAEDIKLEQSSEFKKDWKEKKPPRANPKFDWMMDDVIRFFKKYVFK